MLRASNTVAKLLGCCKISWRTMWWKETAPSGSGVN